MTNNYSLGQSDWLFAIKRVTLGWFGSCPFSCIFLFPVLHIFLAIP